MNEKIKCPYCESENVTRMDGFKTTTKYGPNIMIDIAPEIVHCNDCSKDFKVKLFENIEIDDD